MRKAILCISDEGPLSENSLKKCDNHLKTLTLCLYVHDLALYSKL